MTSDILKIPTEIEIATINCNREDIDYLDPEYSIKKMLDGRLLITAKGELRDERESEYYDRALKAYRSLLANVNEINDFIDGNHDWQDLFESNGHLSSWDDIIKQINERFAFANRPAGTS